MFSFFLVLHTHKKNTLSALKNTFLISGASYLYIHLFLYVVGWFNLCTVYILYLIQNHEVWN